MSVRRYIKYFDRKTSKLVLVAIIVLLLLGGIAFLGRGVLRSDILPSYTSHLHKNELTTVLNAQKTSANAALQPLGMRFNHTTGDSCTLDIAIRWSTAVDCYAEIDSTALVSTSLDKDNTKVRQANQAMKSVGWNGGVDNSGFTLMSYDKIIQGFDCTVQIFNDGTESRLFCNQEYYFFGNPYNKL